jgi:hypothetical protein
MSPWFRYTLLWIAGSALLVFAALGMIGAAYVEGHYIPSNPDAFYHARRILDAVMQDTAVIQFDPRIHVPEGSWLTWPWGFDTLLARITSAFGPYENEYAASRVLMNIPVAAAPVAVAFLLVLTRQLRLTGAQAAIAVIAFALLPGVFTLFAVGNLDHHFAEMLWLLMTMCATLWFYDARTRLAPALVLAGVLGSAVAMQNGLFILQLIVLLPFGWRWLRGEELPEKRVVLVFAGALLAFTVAACVPSQPWRRGFFEFYTLSWFHAYIAFCTGGVMVLMSRLRNRGLPLALVLGAALLAALPIAGIAMFGTKFVSGDLESVGGVIEAYSPYRVYALYGHVQSTRYASWLMWLAMPAWLLNVYWAVRTRDTRLQVFAFASVLFLGLYQLQYRFGSVGAPFLLLTPLILAHQLADRWPARRWAPLLGAIALFVIAYIPTASAWSVIWARGGDPSYERVRRVFPEFERACQAAPGTALALVNDGHWITFHTKCSVIGDVFLLTPQHARKRVETDALFQLTPRALLEKRPDIRYVFVRHSVEVGAPRGPGLPEQPDLEEVRPYLLPLARDMLAPEPALPPQFRLIAQSSTPAGRAYARVYEIERDTPGAH